MDTAHVTATYGAIVVQGETVGDVSAHLYPAMNSFDVRVTTPDGTATRNVGWERQEVAARFHPQKMGKLQKPILRNLWYNPLREQRRRQ